MVNFGCQMIMHSLPSRLSIPLELHYLLEPYQGFVLAHPLFSKSCRIQKVARGEVDACPRTQKIKKN